MSVLVVQHEDGCPPALLGRWLVDGRRRPRRTTRVRRRPAARPTCPVTKRWSSSAARWEPSDDAALPMADPHQGAGAVGSARRGTDARGLPRPPADRRRAGRHGGPQSPWPPDRCLRHRLDRRCVDRPAAGAPRDPASGDPVERGPGARAAARSDRCSPPQRSGRSRRCGSRRPCGASSGIPRRRRT